MAYDVYKGYLIINGFGYTHVTYPGNIHDAIIVLCGKSWRYDVPYHEVNDYIKHIKTYRIQKAKVISKNINFLKDCSTLKYLSINPSCDAGADFDYSPLYDMPEIISFSCHSKYGDREQFIGHIDYSKINGLIDLGLQVTKGTINYNKIPTLKSLHVTDFKGKNRDLTDLFVSEQLDSLRMIQCGITSLKGIEASKKMQCLYLHYNRSLSDISALNSVKNTLKALRIENCSKIKDFSVLRELENLELLELSGSNELPNLDFIKTMKKLKTFTFTINVLDGDLSLCKNLTYVYSQKNRKHYNIKDKDLPKVKYVRGNESIDEWRRWE